MVLEQVDPKPFLNDCSTVNTAITPPATVATILSDDYDLPSGANPSSSIPWPGSTFIVRSVSCGLVLTLLAGRVVLAPPGDRGNIHWECVERKGWLGFRNPVSGKFLGHNLFGFLECGAEKHDGWENFCVRITPNGGYVLLMTDWGNLQQVGTKMDWGVEKLGKVVYGSSDGIVWEFIKVS